ncbi:ABC-F family ATP-binding cassette domain-containing protein [Pantoea sp.]|uniref:ABC-F family ATP-binding cassette domain-containing protein n=1 Tax=Pantoea sp. TaxID=69393 RepID=UPI0028AF817A|nr:ABC-F family ATP-binding cassette domain-containing protein [Pantoea sp.]
MTNKNLVLKHLSCVLPDGRVLFSDLNEQFDMRPTGLVGRNGVGKTFLAQILAGKLHPTHGSCHYSGTVHYLAQQVAYPDGYTVADLAGIKHIIDALERIETGNSAPEDFDVVGNYWDIRQRLNIMLQCHNLDHLEANTPASILSGGESMRVALAGAMLSDADFLILDEPTNHLDRPNRQALIEQLQNWSRGVIVVSHDRQLLDSMQRIVELSSQTLKSYGGNYSFYVETRANEQQTAQQNLDELRNERRRQSQEIQKQHERQERRSARGNRQGKDANQARILLGRQKERSEKSAGILQRNQAASKENITQRIREAERVIEDAAHINLHQIPVSREIKRRIAELKDVVLPYAGAVTGTLSMVISGQQRIGVIGPNGCGKSTLLRMIAGRQLPQAGEINVNVPVAWLDQRLDNLPPEKTVLEQLQSINPAMSEGVMRMRLAQLGLDAQKIATPAALLSGGERLKGALACIIYAATPPQLLLLDEPNNHLDLPSVGALEAMIRGYHGSLMVISHDDAFLSSLGLTDRLIATKDGWRLETL